MINNYNDIDMERSMEDGHNSSRIGLAAFFKQQEPDYIQTLENLYEDHLPEKYKKLPNEIKKKRNQLIYLAFFQIMASFMGMFYIIFRRSYIYLVINLFTVFLAFCGVYGVVKMNLMYLFIHCLFTTSITGGFFIYQLFDFFLVEDTSYGVKKRINDNIILIIFSFPYIYDLCVGVFNYFFLSALAEYNQAKENMKKNDLEKLTKSYSNNQIKDHLMKNERNCIICVDGHRTTVVQPCGHVLACENCIKTILKKSSILQPAKCPLCRVLIESYVKCIIS